MTVREDCVFATGARGGPELAFCLKFYANPTLTTTAAVVETVIPMNVQAHVDMSDRVGFGWQFSSPPAWMQAVVGPLTRRTCSVIGTMVTFCFLRQCCFS